MICVLDASAALEVVLHRKHANQIEDHILNAEQVIAPDLYVAEITNTFWKYTEFSKLDEEAAEKGIDLALELIDHFEPAHTLFREAFGLSCRISHSVYDALYFVLARRNNALLLTMDEKMKTMAGKIQVKTSR
ncbi:type II toxin-antitoxin system VapC family toxin [bacterium]|nr:type II toxin-antitoxin system VapC family toxin [bacterium]